MILVALTTVYTEFSVPPLAPRLTMSVIAGFDLWAWMNGYVSLMDSGLAPCHLVR